MMRKIYIAGLIGFIVSSSCYAQSAKDSLFALLKSGKEDTAKAMLLINIADQYEYNNQDSALYFLNLSKSLSQKLNFKNGLFTYYQNAMIVSYTKGNYAMALPLGDTALALARQLRDSVKVVTIIANLGNIYQYTGDFDRQLENLLKALSIAQQINLEEKIPGIYHNVANAYYNLEQWKKCIEYCNLSLGYKNPPGGYIYQNRLFSTLGQAYYSLKLTDSALFYFEKAVLESANKGDTYAESAIYGYMVNAYADKHNYSQMLWAADRSLTISRNLQSDQLIASALYNSAFAKYLNDNNDGAKKDIQEALYISLRDSLQDELKNSYIILSYIAAKEGDKKTLLNAMYKADSIKTAQLNEVKVKATSELEKKFETEKKDNQIKLQNAEIKRKKIFNYFLSGGSIALIVILLLGFRNYKHTQKLQQQRIVELETQQQLTATEAVLKGEEQERTRLAKDLHDGLGGMLSGIKYSFSTMKGNLVMTPDNAQAFERSMDMLDSSIKEMRRVAHNMMPEALVKFGLDTALKDFCNEINQSGAIKVNYQSIGLENVEIDKTISITVYRIVQELINNTMKHAQAKAAIVQISKSGDQLSVTVEDDGHGFDTSILNSSHGIGWTNIQNRVEFLKGKLDVNSTKDKGTSVLIELTV